MGEQKRRDEQKTPIERAIDELANKCAAEGRLIEVGWLALRRTWLHPDTPPESVDMMRRAFMAGAQHLFSTIMTIMGPGEEPTAEDMRRMDLINTELSAFYAEVVGAGIKTEGSA